MFRKRLGSLLMVVVGCLVVLTAASQDLSVAATISWEKNGPVLDLSDRGPGRAGIVEQEAGSYLFFYEIPFRGNRVFQAELTGAYWEGGRSVERDVLDDARFLIATANKTSSGVLAFPLIHQSSGGDSLLIEAISIGVKTYVPDPVRASGRWSAAHSVLRSGDWFKFGIGRAGVYRLTYEFLQDMGMDLEGVPHGSIRIYGHRGGMLPELAGAVRTDDLEEIPVRIVASGNTLQPGDHIVFYGEGPEKWEFDDALGRFRHRKHSYSDLKCYFITTSSGTGKRVLPADVPSGLPDTVLETFHDRVFLEEDFFNLNKSGRDWLGDEYSINTQRDYPFTFPDTEPGSEAYLDYRVAARYTGGISGFSVYHDGNRIAESVIGPVNPAYTGNAANAASGSAVFQPVGDNVSFRVVYEQPSFSAKGWLDYLAVNASRRLVFRNNALAFRNTLALGYDLVSFRISGLGTQTSVWDVTDLFDIREVDPVLSGQSGEFLAAGGAIREYMVFEAPSELPVAFGKVANQDLHGLPGAELIIITREPMLEAARELAEIHEEEEGMSAHVVLLEEVFNEFSSGNADVTAIRDFMKMFYDRGENYPAYLCLFGDGTFNNKDLGTHLLPTYESENTLNTLATYCSDDYFAFLDDEEGDRIEDIDHRLDLAVGRIPADNPEKARAAVDKVRDYYSSASYGNWRNVGTFVADDEDLNIHIGDGEAIADDFISSNPVMNVEKIYLDAYRQVAGAGGGLYPDVNRAINNRIFRGTLFLNYIGHGGGNGLAEERVVTLEDIDSWENPAKLPLIISATCEFTRYDDIERYSAGERAFFKQDGGAVALVTTVRLVFSNKNFEMNKRFMEAFEKGLYEPSLKLGDIMVDAKNNTLTGTGNRKFALIGDPALRIAFPAFKVQSTAVNGSPYTAGADTLKALTKVTVEGEVRGHDGQLMEAFSGLVYPSVYDKKKTLYTLGNDERSIVTDFEVQNSIIYSGKVQAVGGRFQFAFVVPKDIVYTIGDGKISYYAEDGAVDAAGVDTVLVGGGGSLDSSTLDSDDPLVEVFIDDETWISGDFTDSSPDLFVRLFDQNGINTSGSGVGHDIVAILDDDQGNATILNDFYESELNSYQSGTILYPMDRIAEGSHTVRVKAWDVFNNSGEGLTEFIVAEDAGLALDHVLNYPNPFTTSTQFMFEHNRKGDVLEVRIDIFTASGKLVRQIRRTGISPERRMEVPWDGLDQYGDRIGKGVYIYRVSVRDSGGDREERFEKLVLLR